MLNICLSFLFDLEELYYPLKRGSFRYTSDTVGVKYVTEFNPAFAQQSSILFLTLERVVSTATF